MSDDMNNSHSQLAINAAFFALAIRSKRDLLQTLFYSVKNKSAEAGSLDVQLQRIEQPRDFGNVAMSSGDMMPRHDLINAKAAAESTAQDSAMALMLIIDYSLRRFGEQSNIETGALGAALTDDIKLNRVVWALANQARHLHDWKRLDESGLLDADRHAGASVAVIRSCGHVPTNPNAARRIVCDIPVASYIDFEEMLLETAHDALRASGSKLGTLTAGTFRLDISALEPVPTIDVSLTP